MSNTGPLVLDQGVLRSENSLGFVISLVGWAIQVLLGIIEAFSFDFVQQPFGRSGFMFGGMMEGNYFGMMSGNLYGLTGYGSFLTSWTMIFIFSAVLGAIGIALLASTPASRIALGASLVLVSAIISYPTAWGFGIGSAVMIVGAILSFMSVFKFKD
jgi:hypothetical protein